jgi:diguanylate cyclase (GGDEF)-like protein
VTPPAAAAARRGPAAVPPPPRAPVGQTPTVRGRLALQRPRPVLVRLYAALLGDMGVAGAPARRRFLRLAARALPSAAVAAAALLVVLRVFEGLAPGRAQLAAAGALALALATVVQRRLARAARREPFAARERLELGLLFLLAAHAVSQAAGLALGVAGAAVQPLVYLVLAFLVASLGRPAALAVVALAVGLEAVLFWSRGAVPGELPGAIARAAFAAAFAGLTHLVLSARLAAAARVERAAVALRMEEIVARAREFRLLEGSEGLSDPDHARRWTEAAVVEIEAAVRGALEIAEVALRTHTAALFLLTDDDTRLVLRECRSASEAVTREPLPAGEGALGGAVKRRAPVRLHGDLRVASWYSDGTRPRALLAVPVVDRRGDHVRGVLLVDRLEDRAFGDEDERLLATLAGEVLRAVAAERLMRDVKRARDEKERFYAAMERLNKTAKPAEAFEATLDVARAMAPVTFAALTVVEEVEGRQVHRVARVSAGDAAGRLEGLEFDDALGLVASVVRLGSTLPAKDLDVAKAHVFDAATRLRGLASLKVVPLRTGERTLGTLVVGSDRPHAYGRDAVRQLEVIAMQAAESVLRARLFEQTERLATTDGLTGLTNHRTFQVRLDEQLALSQRYGKRLSLLLCDIDHFKSVNDTYGHPVGDVVLKGVAKTLAKEARNTDVVARYGGEEFAIVMPETDTAGALVIAERIRERVGKLSFETGQGPLRITMSLGVATFPDDAQVKAALVERADGCLYHAKRHGRNQSVAASAVKGTRRPA